MRDRDRDRDWSAYRMGAGGGGGPDAFPLEFGDDFNRADGALGDNWTSELATGGSGSPVVGIVSNACRMVSTSAQYSRAWWNANQIPEEWTSIIISGTVNMSNSSNCDFTIGLTMGDPTGVPTTFADGSRIANGYVVTFRPGTFTERVARIHASSASVVLDSDLSSLATGSAVPFEVRFTKLSDRVRIQLFWNGSQIGSDVDDTDANRKVGACYVGLAAFAQGTVVDFDNFSVVADDA